MKRGMNARNARLLKSILVGARCSAPDTPERRARCSAPLRNHIERVSVARGIVAQLALKLPANVEGDFFVDSTCIDCDACRVFAPTVFSDEGDQSTVYHQPETDDERLAAEKALISCLTASIGTASKHDMRGA